MYQEPHKRFKTVLLGNSYCGKTSLVLRYVSKKFTEINSNTIGCSFFAKIVKIKDTPYGLDIWDTAGQERYRSLLPMYYRNADIVFICIDMTEVFEKSLENIKYWLGELDTYNDTINRLVIVVGTKSDLLEGEQVEDFIEYMKSNIPDIDLLTTSSKLDLNVEHLFNVSLTKSLDTIHSPTTQNTFQLENQSKTIKHTPALWGFCSIL